MGKRRRNRHRKRKQQHSYYSFSSYSCQRFQEETRNRRPKRHERWSGMEELFARIALFDLDEPAGYVNMVTKFLKMLTELSIWCVINVGQLSLITVVKHIPALFKNGSRTTPHVIPDFSFGCYCYKMDLNEAQLDLILLGTNFSELKDFWLVDLQVSSVEAARSIQT